MEVIFSLFFTSLCLSTNKVRATSISFKSVIDLITSLLETPKETPNLFALDSSEKEAKVKYGKFLVPE
jgi:hypothetical protein